MNISERNVETRVQFWSILGPFVILLSTVILLFKVSSYWIIPVAAMTGIPLCVKWKMKGLVLSLVVLFAFFLFSYSALDLNERYWHVGLGMAMALSLIILALSLEEGEGLIQKLQLESQSRLNNLLHLDEKMKGVEQEERAQREEILSRLNSLTDEYSQLQEEKLTYQKLAHLSKDELVTLRSHYETLVQDLFYKKQHMAQLYERLEECEATIQQFIDSNVDQQKCVLEEQLFALEANLKRKEEELARASEYQQQLEKACEQQEIALRHQCEHSNLQLKEALDHLEQMQEKQMLQLQREHLQLQQAYAMKCDEVMHLSQQQERCNIQHEEQLKEYMQVLEQDRQELAEVKIQLLQLQGAEERLQKLQQACPAGQSRSYAMMYIQLREQFEEKSAILDATRRELFQAQETLIHLQKELEEEQLQPREAEIYLQREIGKLVKEIEELQIQNRQEIDALYDLVDHIIKLNLVLHFANNAVSD